MEGFAADFYWNRLDELVKPGQWWKIMQAEHGVFGPPACVIAIRPNGIIRADNVNWVVETKLNVHHLWYSNRGEYILYRLSDAEVVAMCLTGKEVEI